MRSLNPEEAELWARVTATISPLSREKMPAQPAEQKAQTPAPKLRLNPKAGPENAGGARAAKPGTTLDASWDRRLRSGAIEPDRVLDLHGMNLDSAWRAIDRGLEDAVWCGVCVLL